MKMAPSLAGATHLTKYVITNIYVIIDIFVIKD